MSTVPTIIYIILIFNYYYETASQSLALYERVWCTYVVSKRRFRRRTYAVQTPVGPAFGRMEEAASGGWGRVRRLRRRYGRAGRGGTTNKQTNNVLASSTEGLPTVALIFLL